MDAEEQFRYDEKPHPLTGDIFKAIPKIMAEIEAVGKNQRNKEQNYAFRGIDDLYNAVQRVMAKHGVFTTIHQLDRRDTERKTASGKPMLHSVIQYRIRFYASDGSFIDNVISGEAMDTSDKTTNKTISGAHKYAILTTLMVPTQDLVDGDAETPDLGPNQRPAPQEPRQAPTPAVRPVVAPNPTNAPLTPNPKGSAGDGQRGPSDAQLKRLFAIAAKANWTNAEVKARIQDHHAVMSSKDLTRGAYDALCDFIEKNPKTPDQSAWEPGTDDGDRAL